MGSNPTLLALLFTCWSIDLEYISLIDLNNNMRSKLLSELEIIRERYISGETAKEISMSYNVYPGSIIHLLKKNNIPIRSGGQRKGSLSWNKGKLTSEEQKINHSQMLFDTGRTETLAEQTVRSHAKRILIFKNGNCCSICNTSEWQGQPVPLVCDHIDGDSFNNKFENFRLVCCNCDAQLPTYKSKNRGRGRSYDRQRYHETK